jgi:hypothetical protein
MAICGIKVFGWAVMDKEKKDLKVRVEILEKENILLKRSLYEFPY